MITNLRDIGGIPVATGELVPGFFYRSGQLTDLTKTETALLTTDCQIKKAYDFRSDKEIEEQPDTTIPGIVIEHIDILASSTKDDGASLQSMLINAGNIEDSMMKTYEDLVLSSSAQKGYHQFFTEILIAKDPLLFHCFAGKDRTGFAAALILKIAGATDEQIMTDYVITNESRKSANEEIIASFRDQLTPKQLNGLTVALKVDQAYLLHAQKLIVEHFGSFDIYLVNGLDLDKDYTEQFRQRFVKNN